MQLRKESLKRSGLPGWQANQNYNSLFTLQQTSVSTKQAEETEPLTKDGK